MSDALETLKRHIEQTGCVLAEDTPHVVEVLAMVDDCERDHPPEPWASEAKAENERLRDALKESARVKRIMSDRFEAALAIAKEAEDFPGHVVMLGIVPRMVEALRGGDDE
jgi:hypothetical protein